MENLGSGEEQKRNYDWKETQPLGDGIGCGEDLGSHHCCPESFKCAVCTKHIKPTSIYN